MRASLSAVCALAGWLVAVGDWSDAAGQGPRTSVYANYANAGSFQPSAGGGLIAQFATSTAGPHTIAVIDPARQVLAVYHVDAASGAITLKSVRNLSWDLQMIQFNSDGPTPQDVRGGLRSATNGHGTNPNLNPQPGRTTETEASRRIASPALPGG
jgi:hypothetical protein